MEENRRNKDWIISRYVIFCRPMKYYIDLLRLRAKIHRTGMFSVNEEQAKKVKKNFSSDLISYDEIFANEYERFFLKIEEGQEKKRVISLNVFFEN